MRKTRLAALFPAALMLILTLGACGASDSGGSYYAESPEAYYDGDYNYYSYEEPVDTKAAMAAAEAPSEEAALASGMSSAAPVNTDPNRKIVYTVNLDLETRDFDSAADQVYGICSGLGGYVESSYVSGSSLNNSGGYSYRYASFTLRVPVQNLDKAVGEFENSFNVVSSNRSSDDITSSYYDVDARLKSLAEEEQRLLEMLENADELQYMIQIEDKLSEIRYQIENYYSRLQRMDSSVSYSTLNITINEVHNYNVVTHPISFGERIRTAFVDSWAGFASGVQDFCVWFVEAFPTLIVWAVIIALIVIIIRAVIRHRRKKKKSMPYPMPYPQAAPAPVQPSADTADSVKSESSDSAK
ncbi:MAG: DUF4349 domain-containing protein [Clostridia bacterium]|nr:DUF4349 domain-containing protein [Clostridia bacterium]